jgi:hypothetical protein
MRSYLLILSLSALSSCAYTGDPSEGGLFGYSGRMFEQRVAEKHAVIGNIEGDTARQRAEAERLQRQINAQQ